MFSNYEVYYKSIIYQFSIKKFSAYIAGSSSFTVVSKLNAECNMWIYFYRIEMHVCNKTRLI